LLLAGGHIEAYSYIIITLFYFCLKVSSVTDIKVAFWNLGNLFDINLSETSLIHEFIPDKGWYEEVLDKKIENWQDFFT
jgi:hypothetical protein